MASPHMQCHVYIENGHLIIYLNLYFVISSKLTSNWNFLVKEKRTETWSFRYMDGKVEDKSIKRHKNRGSRSGPSIFAGWISGLDPWIQWSTIDKHQNYVTRVYRWNFPKIRRFWVSLPFQFWSKWLILL